MLIHVAGGTVGLAAAAAAMILPKGGRAHRKAGTIFVVAMLALALSGSLIAAGLVTPRSDRGTAVIGILTTYLVATSWSAARRRDARTGWFERAAFLVGAGCALAMFGFGIQALNAPNGRLDGLPAPVFFPFATVAALAAALDLNFMLRRDISGVQRIGRHLWRMSAALFIAAASFFLGQQDEFPAAWQGAFIWSVPPIATLLAMFFWIVRVRFSKAFRRAAPLGAGGTRGTVAQPKMGRG